MALNVTRFLNLLFAALALVPAGAHLLEMPNLIALILLVLSVLVSDE